MGKKIGKKWLETTIENTKDSFCKSAIYVVARGRHPLQGLLTHHAYLDTRDMTISKDTPTCEPTIHLVKRLDVGLEPGKAKQPDIRKCCPPVGGFICRIGTQQLLSCL